MSILTRGAAIYAEYCQRCHGQFAVSNGRIPDLRRSAEAVYSAFNVIVIDGGLEQLGMHAFKDVRSSDDALSLKAYLIDAANDDWERRPASRQ